MSSYLADFETRSRADLPKVGAHIYAEDPSTEVLCCAWVNLNDFNDRGVWRRGDPPPTNLIEADTIWAHNAQFEAAIWNGPCVDIGWQPRPTNTFRCLMKLCAFSGLPLGLEMAAAAAGTGVAKDMEGHRLMLKLCKPNARGEMDMSDEEFERLCVYAEGDIDSELALYCQLMHAGTPMELRVMEIDATINDRGFLLDREAAVGASSIADVENKRLNGDMRRLTNGRITTTNQRQRIIDFALDHGVDLPNLKSETVREALIGSNDGAELDLMLGGEEMPPIVAAVLELRAEANKASVAKLKAMVRSTDEAGWFRGGFAYGGAARTLRWSGRRVQAQNLARNNPPEDVSPELWFDTLATGDREAFARLLPEGWTVMDGLRASLRGMIVPPEGRVLVVRDLRQIEARVLPWLAQQNNVIEDCWAYDLAEASGASPETLASLDMYVKTGLSMGMDRQAGKVGVLGCFTPDTLVLVRELDLTVRCIPIIDVTLEHQVWDGIEWVQTAGPICRGLRSTIALAGVEVTPDHDLLCGETWVQAQEATADSILRRVLETGSENLPSEASSSVLQAASSISSVSVRAADPCTKFMNLIFGAGNPHGVDDAPVSSRQEPVRRSITATLTSCLTWLTGSVCSVASALRSTGAKTPETRRMSTTAQGAYASALNGAVAQPGDERSLPTSSPWMGGMNRTKRWIGSTTARAINPATSGSPPGERSGSTSAPSQKQTPRRLVYDLALCGPRQRFTVITSRGPIVVHNCGFQASWRAIQRFARGYGMRLTEDEANDIVTSWREANPKIVSYWYEEERAAIYAMKHTGTPVSMGHAGAWMYNGTNLLRRLPSGRCICYRNAALVEKQTPWGEMREVVSFDSNFFRKGVKVFYRDHLYGGRTAENVTQAVARDILAVGMVRAEDRLGIPIHMHVHDELGTYPTLDRAEEVSALLGDAMTQPIRWAPGLPIASSADILTRYRKS